MFFLYLNVTKRHHDVSMVVSIIGLTMLYLVYIISITRLGVEENLSHSIGIFTITTIHSLIFLLVSVRAYWGEKG